MPGSERRKKNLVNENWGFVLKSLVLVGGFRRIRYLSFTADTQYAASVFVWKALLATINNKIMTQKQMTISIIDVDRWATESNDIEADI
jgi:hypothetical protein